MKQLESLNKYVIEPNIGFYGGFVYDGEDIFLCDDHDKEEGYDFHVVQKIENNRLISDLTRKYTRANDKWVTEESHQEVEIEKGQLLVYVEGLGFAISEHKMCTVDEAMELYGLLKG